MITIIDNLKLLKEDNKNLLNMNKIRNQTIKGIIKKKIDSLKDHDFKNNVTITINGNVENFSFEICSEDNETIRVITEKFSM